MKALVKPGAVAGLELRDLPVPEGADVRFVRGPVAEALPAIREAAGDGAGETPTSPRWCRAALRRPPPAAALGRRRPWYAGLRPNLLRWRIASPQEVAWARLVPHVLLLEEHRRCAREAPFPDETQADVCHPAR